MKCLLSLLPYLLLSNLGFANIDSLKTVAFQKTVESTERINAYKKLAEHYQYSSLDTGLYYVDQGIELAENDNDLAAQTVLHQTKGRLYLNFYEDQKGMTFIKLAIGFAEQSKNDSLIAAAVLETGFQYLNIANWDSAAFYSEQCIQVAKEAEQYDILFKANNNAGTAYLDLSMHSTAQNAFMDASRVNKILNNEKYEATLNLNLGRLQDNLSNYDKAVEYYYKSLDYAIAKNDKNFLRVLYANIAGVQVEMEEYRLAIDNTYKALQINQELGDKYLESWNCNALGITYNIIDETDSAIYFNQQAIALKSEIGDSSHLGYIYNSMADVYKNREEYDKAEDAALKTLELGQIYTDPSADAYAYLLLAQVVTGRDKVKGLAYFYQAEELSKAYNFNHILIDIYHDRYLFYKKMGDYEKAIQDYEAYSKLNEEIFGEERKVAIKEIEIRHEVDQKENEIKLLEKNQEIQSIEYKSAAEKNRSVRQLLLLAFGITLLAGIIIVLFYRQKQKNKITAIEKRNLRMETDKLRSQINPHFIFNSLNAIQSFISGNETIDAERYLAKFSRLMRLILENSRSAFIDFENELETLTLYLELEQLRFDHKFQFEIRTNNIDSEYTQIPPMLAQPYIENAILHGVRTIENGKITVDYVVEDEKISCTIDDNGIGRAQAQALKSAEQTNHTSLGIQVTQERIDLLSKEYNLDLCVNIIDKIGEKNEPLGTKIILEMPWIE